MSKKAGTRLARKRREIEDINFEENISKNWSRNFTIKQPFYLNDRHKQFYAYCSNKNTNMVFVDGPAGSAKTYLAVYTALEQIKERTFDKLIYIRSVAESAEKSLGYLPGELNEKFSPYIVPLADKVTEITNESTVSYLQEAGIIDALPVNFVRGLTFNNTIVIVDEAQNLTKGELTTILTRFGRNSRYIICGDSKQTDISKSGFKEIYDRFNTQESVDNHIHTFRFTQDDIIRSKILRYICNVLEA